jgi:VCBS repeat protein
MRRSPALRSRPSLSFVRRAGALLVLALAACAAARAASWRRTPPYAPGFPLLFPRTTDIRPRAGALVAADPDHDGSVDLIVSIPSGVLTIVGRDGRTRQGWPHRFTSLPQPAWPCGRPAIGDLDGDGVDEIATCVTAGSTDRRAFLAVLRADGTDAPGWPVELSTGGCSPAATLIVDLDGDGRREVIRAEGHQVHGFDSEGRPLSGWPWVAPLDAAGRARPINADPVAADLDGDGRPEIIVAESGFESRVFAVDAAGHTLVHFPIALGQVVDRQAPAAADVDRDGKAEIVQATLPFSGDMAAASGPQADGQTGTSPGTESPAPGPLVPASLHLLRQDGTDAPGWPLFLGDGAIDGALVADLDGSGASAILQGDGDRVEGYDAQGLPLRGFPLVVHGLPRGADARIDTPWSVADLDADGAVDLLRVSGFVEAGAASLRVIGLRVPSGSARGYPFAADGALPSSASVAVDLTGDGVPEVVLLVSEGTNGGWRLVAWDVSAG